MQLSCLLSSTAQHLENNMENKKGGDQNQINEGGA